MNKVVQASGPSPFSWGHAYGLPVLLTCLALAAAVGDAPIRALLRFDRSQMAGGGELWRWLSAHIVHAGWSHTLLNLAGLWVVWVLFSPRLHGRIGWGVSLISIAVMNVGFWFRDADLFWYVGMSGLLHGLFAAGALNEVWRGLQGGRWLLLGLAAKLAYEQFAGALPFTASASGGPVWVNSHFYGAIGGALAMAVWNWRQPFTPLLGLSIFSRKS